MMNHIRNSVFIKIIWGLLGLYFLNISVDPVDPFPEHISEDLTFNDQESIIEIFVEQILGYENAIKEYDDHDTEDYNKKSNVKVDLLLQQFKTNQNVIYQFSKKKQLNSDYEAKLTNGYKKIVSPPPKT